MAVLPLLAGCAAAQHPSALAITIDEAGHVTWRSDADPREHDIRDLHAHLLAMAPAGTVRVALGRGPAAAAALRRVTAETRSAGLVGSMLVVKLEGRGTVRCDPPDGTCHIEWTEAPDITPP